MNRFIGIVAIVLAEALTRALLGVSRLKAQLSGFLNTTRNWAANAADIVGAVAFFCSTDTYSITGQALNVDSGCETN